MGFYNKYYSYALENAITFNIASFRAISNSIHHENGFQGIFKQRSVASDLCLLIALGFNDTSTLLGLFVLSPRERKKRDRRDSRRDEGEEQGRKRNRNRRNKNIPTLPLPTTRIAGLAQL